MAEAGSLLPVSFAPLAPGWAAALPAWRADPHVIAFCQSVAVLTGLVGAMVLLRRLLQSSRLAWGGAALLAVLLAAAGRWLVAV